MISLYLFPTQFDKSVITFEKKAYRSSFLNVSKYFSDRQIDKETDMRDQIQPHFDKSVLTFKKGHSIVSNTEGH